MQQHAMEGERLRSIQSAYKRAKKIQTESFIRNIFVNSCVCGCMESLFRSTLIRFIKRNEKPSKRIRIGNQTN